MDKKSGVLTVFTVILLIVTSFGAVVYGDNDDENLGEKTVVERSGLYGGGEGMVSEDAKNSILASFASSSTYFTENKGQFPDEVLFQAHVCDATVYLCRDSVASVFTREINISGENDHEDMMRVPMSRDYESPKMEMSSVVTRFVNASAAVVVVGEDMLPHKNNYFIGNDPSKWYTDVPNYQAVLYKNVYPGIDLRYYGHQGSLKYDFIVQSGADPSLIRMKYEGVETIKMIPRGDLEIKTKFGALSEKNPVIYQEKGHARVEILGGYDIMGEDAFGFSIQDEYDQTYPLIIDPELVYSTYLGGASEERSYDIVVDVAGNAYITGYTRSSDFPVENPYSGTYCGGPSDVFVTKLSPSGNSLVYSTFLGGTYGELGYGVAVDGSGNAIIAGYTTSSDFPMVNSIDDTHNGVQDVFVTKLSSTGNSLLYSTYLGGTYNDQCRGVAVDNMGNAYITGQTLSSDFPMVNSYDNTYNGDGGTAYGDVFAAKLSPNGNSLLYSTYLGGGSGEEGWDVAVDGAGNAYVAGRTWSSDFPVESPYDDTFNGGGTDVFVTKLSPSGNTLVYSTYLGGTAEEYGFGVAVDASGNAYVTGMVYSVDFPMVNAYDDTHNGGSGFSDVFVTKLSPSGATLVYSTYLGGTKNDDGFGVAVDASGYAYITGRTLSYDFPTVNAYDGTLNGSRDAFVAKLSPGGNSLFYSTYLGGSGLDDEEAGIAVDNSGNVYITGFTWSSDFPMMNPYDDTHDGNADVFVAKMSLGEFTDGLLYSTYLGGTDDDGGCGIAIDSSGNICIAGNTASGDFPMVNPYDDTYNGLDDVFVTKLSPTGDTLVYSTYLGGTNNDYATGIAVDGSGNTYIVGRTGSSDFPMVNSYDDTYNGGDRDVFVVKLSPAGNLLYSTYLGGTDNDYGWGIAVDNAGNVIITGNTGSSDFPMVNPYDDTYNGGDVFVAKLSPTGSLLYSTYLGGTSQDTGYGVAVDNGGNAYITGITLSTDFPMVNPYNDTHMGSYDVFVAKLSASGNILLYSTYLGGTSNDMSYNVAVDNGGNAYITGHTYSTDFPMMNPYDGTYNGGSRDIFVAKLAPPGNTLQYSTYLGGTGDEYGEGIVVDGSGNAYITGHTYSTDFPMVNAYDDTYNGSYDVIVAKLSPSGNSLLYSTYIGGTNGEGSYGIAMDVAGNIIITGSTGSSDFPMVNAYDDIYNGNGDVFVAKLGISADDGLVAHWTFDEGTGNTVYDSSGHGNHGTIYGATWTTGISGGALSFDGIDDYVEVPHSDVLTPPDAITVNLWFNETSISPCHSCLLYKAGETPTNNGFRDRIYTLWTCTCWTSNGICLSSTPEGASSQICCFSPEYVYTQNRFFMATGVIDTASNSMKIYINGMQVQECSYLGYDHIRSGNYPLRIGACFHTLGDQYNFSGVIDDVRIYNRALSGTEILTLYYENGGYQSPDPVAHWTFDEGTGNTVYDSSGHGNHGTIYGATWTTGISGGALSFDGIDDYVEVPHSDVLTPPDALTVNLWFNETSVSPCHSCLLYKAGEEPTSDGFRDRIYTLWTRSSRYIHFTSTPEGASSQICCNSPANVYDWNNFSMLTGVIDTASNSMKIYMNGEQIQECSYLGYSHIRSGNYPLRIGACFHTLSDQYNFSGVIDDVRIYNRALSGTEIQSLYYAGGGNRPPVADFTYTQNLVVNETITFNASLSFDPDEDEIVEYLWDLDEDGLFESSGQEATCSMSTPGLHDIILKVKDIWGEWSTAYKKALYTVQPFRFIHLTDTHITNNLAIVSDLLRNNDKNHRYLAEAILEIGSLDPKPDFILIGGDIADFAGYRIETWLGDVEFDLGFSNFIDALASLDSEIKWYAVPGNHDRYMWVTEDTIVGPTPPIFESDDTISMYHDYISKELPDHTDLIFNSEGQSPPDQDNYYFYHKGYYFIGLDSGYEGVLGMQGQSITDAQLAGLKKLDPEMKKVIFMHHPTFDIADRQFFHFVEHEWLTVDHTIQHNLDDFIEYCDNNNVDLVLAGHTHEREDDNQVFTKHGLASESSTLRPLYIQTPDLKEREDKEQGYRKIDVTPEGTIFLDDKPYQKPNPIYYESIGCFLACPATLHAYDSEGRHTGSNISSGGIDRDIPQSFYFSRSEILANESLNITGELIMPETILLYNMSDDYWFEIVANLTEEQRLSPSNNSFNFTLEKQTEAFHLTISYTNISLLENTTAIVPMNDTGNFTMFIDYDGDNITDEERSPDFIETNYMPTATINSPVNHSVYLYGENITFNGTGIDTEDGTLTNSSLTWISSIDGPLGSGTLFTTHNLSVGAHSIELRVNDSRDQIAIANITLTVVGSDLVIDSSNITFSGHSPREGDIITINATISNSGTLNATNVTVQFFVNDTITTTQIGSNYTITQLNMSENKTISMAWDTTGYAGDNTIWVVIPSCEPAPDPIIGNNLAPRDIYVGSPTLLHITQVQTHKTRYVEGETVILGCVVQNATENISATVTSSIQKPEGTSENITLGEQTLGQYQGTFTSTFQSGSYNVTFSATRTGFTGDTELLVFQILDTQPPSPISNLTASFGSSWINWTWDNPTNPDFGYAHVYLNGVRKTATTQGYYLVEGVNTSAQNSIGVLTVDTTGNVNDNWVNMTLPPTIDNIVITYQGKNEIPNQDISTNFTLPCYMAGFNSTYGFVEFVHANWSLANSGCNASIDSSSGLSTNVFSGWYNGTAILTADDGKGHSDTVEFTINSSLFSTVFFKGWNLVTVPFDNDWSAETLGENISGCTVVCRFNASSQSFTTHVVNIPYNDFPIVDGSGYFVYCALDTILSVPDLSILTVNVSIYDEWNIVGWYHDYATTAESLGENITGTTVVCMFNADTQTFTTHVVDIPYNNFPIIKGMAFFIYTTEASYWYGGG